MSAEPSISYPSGVYLNSDGSDPPKIPKLVQNYDQWLCYRRKLKPDGKIDKIPTDPEVPVNIDKTDPDNWLAYEKARAYATTETHVNGVGFALSTCDPFAVIDLDSCRNPETCELAEWARTIITALDSYTEVSPSGTGVHIWIYGTVRGTTRPEVEGHRIEAYSEGAFITVTGERLEGTPDEIVNGQDVLDEWAGDKTESGAIELNDAPIPPEGVTNDEIISKLDSAGNADKFQRLMYETPDPERLSEDDGALVGMVVFYTGGDVNRAESVVRRSVRVRPKWDERRKGVDGEPTTWLRWEIQKAITSRDSEDFYTWGESRNPGFPSNGLGNPVGNLRQKLKAVSFAQGGRPAPRRWAIRDVMPERFAATLYSDSGKAKTFLGVHMGMTEADSNQNRWLGFECITAPVVYMDFEMDETELRRRAYDVAAGMRLDAPPKDFLYIECVEASVDTSFRAAYDTCVDTGAKLVVIDSMGMAMEGDSESSSDVMKFYRRYINPLRSLGVAILIIDHQAKMIKGEKFADKDIFGSTYKKANNRSVFQINGEWTGNVLNATLTHKKANLGPQLDPIPLSLTFEYECVTVRCEDSVVFEASAHDRIVDALRIGGPATNAELAEHLSMKVKDVQNRTGELNGKRIEDTGDRRDRQKVWRVIPSEIPNTNTRESGIPGTLPPDQRKDLNDVLKADEDAA